MKFLHRQIISIVLVLFFLYAMYSGVYLPFRKSQIYIAARQTQINSFKDFDEVYGKALSYESPVGQDEIVSSYLEILAEIIQGETLKEQPNKQIIEKLIVKAEEWANPIVDKGAGFGFSQILFRFGNVYQMAAIALKDDNYYQKSVQLYNLGLQYSPDRQIFLYSLFDMYRFRGDNENAKKVGERIVGVYNDEGVAQSIQSLR